MPATSPLAYVFMDTISLKGEQRDVGSRSECVETSRSYGEERSPHREGGRCGGMNRGIVDL